MRLSFKPLSPADKKVGKQCHFNNIFAFSLMQLGKVYVYGHLNWAKLLPISFATLSHLLHLSSS